MHNFNGISDGTGYIEFDSQKEVLKAMRKDGQYLKERYLKGRDIPSNYRIEPLQYAP